MNKVKDIITKLIRSKRKSSKIPTQIVYSIKRCRRYKGTRYNIYTYIVKIKLDSNSKGSKKQISLLCFYIYYICSLFKCRVG